jgi:YHS domain-containing protein
VTLWLRRAVVWLFLLGLAWLMRRVVRGGAAGSPPADASRRPSDAVMVRDRVCNTFLPLERALRLERDGREHFFCSEACRSSYIAQRAAERAPA